MQIASFIKTSFVDYPKLIACVVFCSGCNFDCWYCHNRDIIKSNAGIINEEQVFDFLKTRIGLIDAVVISGGEATLQFDLKQFIEKCRNLGFKIKLDTNGSNPEIIKDLLDNNLLDFIAMDIKSPISKYEQWTAILDIKKRIKESIEIIKNSQINYEFRTTFAPSLSLQDIEEIAKSLGNVNQYAIQQYRQVPPIDKWQNFPPHTPQTLKESVTIAEKYIDNVILRD